MEIRVTARHVEITEPMKEYAYAKARRLSRYFDHARKLEVILDLDGAKGFRAEMVASLVRGQILVCRAEDRTPGAALDAVVDKMERQLTRFKEKLWTRSASPGRGRRGREVRPGRRHGSGKGPGVDPAASEG